MPYAPISVVCSTSRKSSSTGPVSPGVPQPVSRREIQCRPPRERVGAVVDRRVRYVRDPEGLLNEVAEGIQGGDGQREATTAGSPDHARFQVHVRLGVFT